MKVLGPSSVHEDEGIEEEWLDFIEQNPLPSILNFYEYDHIKASFDGQIGKFDDDDDEEASVKRRSKPADKPRGRKPEPDYDDNEETAKPSSSRRTAKP